MCANSQRIPPEARHEMRFKLIYDGPLPPDNRSRPISEIKAEKRFHRNYGSCGEMQPGIVITIWLVNPKFGPEAIARAYRRGDVNFVPLIRRTNGMLFTLDILVLLRQRPYRSTFQEGDLDSRIKTLIDGLGMPRQPIDDATPELVCLFEDDDLITELSVDPISCLRRSERIKPNAMLWPLSLSTS